MLCRTSIVHTIILLNCRLNSLDLHNELFQAPEGENQPGGDVDLFVSEEKVMVLSTSLKVGDRRPFQRLM